MYQRGSSTTAPQADLTIYNWDAQPWRLEARCVGTFAEGVDFVDPEVEDVPGIVENFCTPCPVRAECLTYAATQPRIPTGIWGGVYVSFATKYRGKGVKALKAEYAMLGQNDAA